MIVDGKQWLLFNLDGFLVGREVQGVGRRRRGVDVKRRVMWEHFIWAEVEGCGSRNFRGK